MQLIMLIGPSGSGKSTLAAEIAAHDEGVVILSGDSVLEDFAYANEISYAEAYAKFYPQALDVVLQTAEAAFSQGKNVIWDQTNLKRSDRIWRLELVPDSYQKTAVQFVTNFEDCRARIKARAEAGGRDIPDFVLRQQFVDLDAPDYDEGFDRIVQQVAPVTDREPDPEPCM